MNHIRYVEYNAAHGGNFVFSQPHGHDCWLLLLTHTPALFDIPDTAVPDKEKGTAWKHPVWKQVEYSAHCAVLFPPHARIRYQACAGRYENDWLRFDSDEDLVSSLPIQQIPFPVADMEYCHSLFRLLTWEHSFPGPDSSFVIDRLIQILFAKLHEAARACLSSSGQSPRAASPHYQELLLLRKAILNSPQQPWSISRMAGCLHLSEGYLQSQYRKTFGNSCMDDVITARIRMACDRLRFTDKPVAQIAEESGYNNTEHFCRQFRKHTGMTPGAFRKGGNASPGDNHQS